MRNVHEMGEMKRAQELRVDEVSVQKLREGHETIQRLSSHMQELQEMVNCMNDSGEFQETVSNYGGKFSHVLSQPAVVPSPHNSNADTCKKAVDHEFTIASGDAAEFYGWTTTANIGTSML